MRPYTVLVILLLIGCAHRSSVAATTEPAREAQLTPTSPSVADTPTWFDNASAAADRDPRFQRDKIRELAQRKIETLSWMEGRWLGHYHLLATPKYPEFRRDFVATVTITRGHLWLMVSDSRRTADVNHFLTYDPATSRWKRLEVGLPTYASYAETDGDWNKDELVFHETMPLASYLGKDLTQRETWRRISHDEWSLTVEERLSDGRYVLIEEFNYTRSAEAGPAP